MFWCGGFFFDFFSRTNNFSSCPRITQRKLCWRNSVSDWFFTNLINLRNAQTLTLPTPKCCLIWSENVNNYFFTSSFSLNFVRVTTLSITCVSTICSSRIWLFWEKLNTKSAENLGLFSIGNCTWMSQSEKVIKK